MYVNKEKTYSALGWLTIGVLLFFVSAAAVLKMIDLRVDYPAHIEIVCKITWEALIHPMAFLEENCYPIWHILTWLTMRAFDCSVRSAAAVVTGGVCIVGTWAYAAVYFAKKCSKEETDVARVASVCLMLVAPIWLPFFNSDIMLGQGHPNLLHSPTHIMVKCVAFPCFVWYAAVMDGIGKSVSCMGVFKFMALTLLMFLTTLSKPSFGQMFLPAIFLLAAFKVIKYKLAAIRPIATVSVSLVPSIFLMAFQSWVSFYSSHADASGAEIAPLKLWAHFSPNVFVSIMIAVLFPLIVLLWSLRESKVSTADVLAWVMCGMAATEGILLIEKGRRMYHGNFLWAWSLSLFFIWFTAIDRFILLAREHVKTTVDRERRWWFLIASAVLSLHVVSGLCYLWRVIVFGWWR